LMGQASQQLTGSVGDTASSINPERRTKAGAGCRFCGPN